MERLGFWSLRRGQTVPSELSGMGVLGIRIWGPQGWAQEQRRCPSPVISGGPSQPHPHSSLGLSSAKRPEPAKPAVLAGHPHDPLPVRCSRAMAVSRWVSRWVSAGLSPGDQDAPITASCLPCCAWEGGQRPAVALVAPPLPRGLVRASQTWHLIMLIPGPYL